jgi:hypothetical protein
MSAPGQNTPHREKPRLGIFRGTSQTAPGKSPAGPATTPEKSSYHYENGIGCVLLRLQVL